MMVRRLSARRLLVVGLVAATAGPTAAAAQAQTGGAPARLHACVTKSYSKFKVVAPKKRCPRGQRKVSWSLGSMKEQPAKAGPAGPAGAPGPQGAQGSPGERGPEGPSTGPAGGDLTGSYPNPSIAPGAVTGEKIAPATVAGGNLKLPLALSGPADPTESLLTASSGAGGSKPLISATSSLTTAIRPALYGEVNSQFANFGTAGVFGRSSGTGGFAGLFYASNPGGSGPAVVALAEGSGNGVSANASSGDALNASVDGAGDAVYGWVPNFGSGRAAVFANFNGANAKPVLTATQTGTGDIALFRTGSTSVARINAAGRGFFDGGTQTGGADLAEVVPICGPRPRLGDVVEIDPQTPDCFRIARTAGSSRVAGVISTKPGVTLGARADDEAGPALALAGRVPVRVSGRVAIGDLLVASGLPGHAERAGDAPAAGSVIGKALEASEGATDTVTMLVMPR